MSERLKFRLIAILEAIERIDSVTKDVSFEDFRKNSSAILAVTADFAIIGKYAKDISTEKRGRFNLFPLKQQPGFRTKVVHEIECEKVGVLWGAVKGDLPVLKSMIESFLDDFGGE